MNTDNYEITSVHTTSHADKTDCRKYTYFELILLDNSAHCTIDDHDALHIKAHTVSTRTERRY